MSKHDPRDLSEQFEAARGRKAPYTTVPDWVILHPDLDPQALAVYCVLAMHVNVEKKDGIAWPSRLSIAQMLGWSREQSPDKYIQQLEAAGAIDTEPCTRPNGALGKRYIVHETPPPGFDGVTTNAEWYDRKRAAAIPAPRAATPRKAVAAASGAKKSAAKKAAAKKTVAIDKTPEELERDKKAQLGADKWWKAAKDMADNKQMKPLMGSKRQQSGYFLNLRTKIGDALAAGYDSHVIWAALLQLREWSPAKREWETTLAKLNGVSVPRRGGASSRAPLFTNEQWHAGEQGAQGTSSESSPTPDVPGLDVFGTHADEPA
ncbi:hypothetical protein [Streptomyces virginiae]|uniref:hypothetical protein n=1 Tax=Streptomyces virginiae TaxID=1961 RepID=UPI003646E699